MDATVAEQAARQAALSGDLGALARLIESEWVHLVRVPGLMAELLARLGPEHFKQHPALELIMDRSRVAYPRPPGPIPDKIITVEQLIESGGFADEEVRVSVEHAVLLALKDHSQYARAKAHASTLRAVGERLILNPSTDFRKLGAISLHNGVINLLAGDLFEAGGDLHAVTYLPDVHPSDLAGAAGELALLHAVYGEHATAHRWADHADAVADGWAMDWLVPGPHLAQLCAQLILATDRLDWPRYEEILGRLHTGRFVHDEHLFLAMYAQGRAGLVRGQQGHLLDQIAHLRRTWPKEVPPGSLPQTLLSAVETELAISVGDHHRARSLIPSRITDHHQALQLARWQLATGRHTEAADLISGGPWLQRAPRRGVIDLSLTLATALERLGDHRRSARLVLQSLTQAGEPRTIGHSLASMDQQTLINAAEYEPAVRAALDWLQVELVVLPSVRTEHGPRPALTPRERVILELLAGGGTAAEIADTLFVSVHTVRNQIQRVYRKLQATSRQHAIDLATRQGLLPGAAVPRDPVESGS